MKTDKEHVAAKERQEIELAAQRVTLHEQRTHIDILDTALTNAQSNVVRLEEEVEDSNLSRPRFTSICFPVPQEASVRGASGPAAEGAVVAAVGERPARADRA
jgi:hypothetical protein